MLIYQKVPQESKDSRKIPERGSRHPARFSLVNAAQFGVTETGCNQPFPVDHSPYMRGGLEDERLPFMKPWVTGARASPH